MPPNLDSSGASGRHKHTLLSKAATNGDSQVEWNLKKLDDSWKKLTPPAEKLTAMTSNKGSSSKVAAPAKATTIAMKAPAKFTEQLVAPVKPAPQHPSVKIEEVQDESDHSKLNPPCNPRHILEATDGSDDEDYEVTVDRDSALESIVADDENELTNEAPEESAEAQLST